MSRPLKLTKEVEKRLAYALELGTTYKLAFQYAGICYKTFRNWMKRGENYSLKPGHPPEKDKYVHFLHHIKKSSAVGAIEMLKIIKKAAPENWQAAAWMLERRFPEDYGRNRIVTGEDEVDNWTTRIEIIGLHKDVI